MARKVFWSGTGNLVAIAAEDSFYVLRFSREAYVEFLENGGELGDEGVEDAFEVVAEISEVIQSARWVGDCLVYITSNNRLNYLIGNQSHTISHFDS
jgi:coatomer subunit beta'